MRIGVFLLLFFILIPLIGTNASGDYREFTVVFAPGSHFVVLPPGSVISVSIKLNKTKTGTFEAEQIYLPIKTRGYYKLMNVYGHNVLKIYIPDRGVDECRAVKQDNRRRWSGGSAGPRRPAGGGPIIMPRGSNSSSLWFEAKRRLLFCNYYDVHNAVVEIKMRKTIGVPSNDTIIRIMKELNGTILSDEIPPTYLKLIYLRGLNTYVNNKFNNMTVPFIDVSFPTIHSSPGDMSVAAVNSKFEGGGNGTSLIFSKISPLFPIDERINELKFDHYTNLSQLLAENKTVECFNRYKIMIYSGHGREGNITPIWVKKKNEFSLDVYVANISWNELCPADYAVLYACLTGYPGGFAENYARKYGSYVFAFTAPVPINPMMDEAVYTYSKVLLETNDPEYAYLFYNIYVLLKIPDAEWFMNEPQSAYTARYIYLWYVATYSHILYRPGS